MGNTGVVDFKAGERVVNRVLLANITTSHNPRRPIPNLQDHLIEEGLTAGNVAVEQIDIDEDDDDEIRELAIQIRAMTPMELMHDLALSDDPARRKRFVDLVEKYESEPRGLVDLADSRRNEEIEPILLRSFRAKNPAYVEPVVNVPVSPEVDEVYPVTAAPVVGIVSWDVNNSKFVPLAVEPKYIERCGIVVGERRCLAAAYNFAKHGIAPDIGAVVRKLTVAEAFDLAIEENHQRKDATNYEEGVIFRRYRDLVNPTGRKWSLREIADKLHMDYQYVRGREALTYLPENEVRRLEAGTLGVTTAIQKGLAIKMGVDKANDGQAPEKKTNRQRVLTLAQVRNLFDLARTMVNGKPVSMDGAENTNKYLQALADVMSLPLDIACKDSNMRIQQEIEVANKADKVK